MSFAILSGIAVLLLSSCSPNTVEITETRELNENEQKPKLVAKSSERFKFALPQTMRQQDSGPRFAYELPEGWSENEEPSPMRRVDLRFGAEQEGEIYLTSAGGSLVDNINRWRRQMGLEPSSQDEVSSLPTRPLLGGSAVLVTLDGDFSGMGAEQALPDYRMIGAVLQLRQGSLFVKMTGPRELVKANEEEFNAFCDSLRVES